MRTFLATLFIVITGTLILWISTDGGRAFTAEEARRLEIRENPRPVPDWQLQNQDAKPFTFQDWHGHFIVVDFIYTSCPSVCLILSSNLRTLQKDFATEGKSDKLRFLSISFDPEKDTPQRLKEHLSHFSADFTNWMALRPTSESQKKAILDFFKVVVIPDEYGGYTHSAGYHIINPDGKLIAIFGVDEMDELRAYLNKALEDKKNASEN